MTTISQSVNNDIHLDGNGVIALSSGKDAYADILKSVVLTLTGELQFSIDDGIPYFETVFKDYGGIDQWINAVRSVINSRDFVISISSFDVSIKDNNLSYEIVVQTDVGEVVIRN